VKAPKVQEIQRADLERLLERARPALSAAEYEQLKAALDTLVYLTQLLGKKNTTIARLRQILFGASSEKSAEVLKSLAGKGHRQLHAVRRRQFDLDPPSREPLDLDAALGGRCRRRQLHQPERVPATLSCLVPAVPAQGAGGSAIPHADGWRDRCCQCLGLGGGPRPLRRVSLSRGPAAAKTGVNAAEIMS
jgi:hypothetical protein